MGDAKPKYLNSPETEVFDKSRNLYGLNRARTSRKPYFLICEGYMDVISLHQAGFTNAVASLGTALTTGHASLIKRYVNEVYLTYDSDEAGTRAALRAMPILKEAGITAKIIRMEPYKDPDEFIKNLGTEAFEERINKARNGFLFSLEILEKEYDMNSPEGKTAFHKEAAKRLTMFEEEIERNNYIEAVAEKYRIGYEELKKLGKTMMIGMISRLTDQKGFDLVDYVMDELCQDAVQIVVLGTGDVKYENMFRHFAWKYSGKVSANIFYSDELSHKIYASCDAFLMPSLFEPCGLSQLMSLRYGTIPIVRETGGLRDTVEAYNEFDKTGTGFSFTNYNAHEMLNTVRYAERIYYDRKRDWNKIVERAMSKDFSWKNSAGQYQELYKSLIGE